MWYLIRKEHDKNYQSVWHYALKTAEKTGRNENEDINTIILHELNNNAFASLSSFYEEIYISFMNIKCRSYELSFLWVIEFFSVGAQKLITMWGKHILNAYHEK